MLQSIPEMIKSHPKEGRALPGLTARKKLLIHMKKATEHTDNSGSLILDATFAPSNIQFPQDFSLLNEAREKLEKIIRRFHTDYGHDLPRTRCRKARATYLNLAKSKRRSAKKIRSVILFMLNCIRRDNGFLEDFMRKGYAPLPGEISLIMTIRKLYNHQLEMYQNKTHRFSDRIVSISQPYIRPIVRGKTKAPVELGTKFDLSLDEYGMGRIANADNVDRIKVERSFSLSKRCYGLGLIRAKTESTTFSTIGLSILTMAGRFVFVFFKLLLQPENFRLEDDMYQECTC